MAYLGIDLGTTNSAAAFYCDREGVCEVVNIDGANGLLPSAVCFDGERVIVGSEAKRNFMVSSDDIVMGVKRLIGSNKKIVTGKTTSSPEEISAYILRELKKCAEKQAGETFDEVVITHPAYFNDHQIYSTKQAGLLAGFNQIKLISEPLAAAIEYGFKKGYEQTLLVYDLGGGTFDTSILRVMKDENGYEIFEEMASVGDMNLGGDEFDLELVNWMKIQFFKRNGVDMTGLPRNEIVKIERRLLNEAEATKKRLSSVKKATVRIAPLLTPEGVVMNLNFDISRDEFESMIRKYVDYSIAVVDEALSRARKTANDISRVILVGGSTLVPLVRQKIAEKFDGVYHSSSPAKSVAMGAAIYGYLRHLPTASVKVKQITRQIFGTEAIIDSSTREKVLIPIIPMGSAIPSRFIDANFKASGAPRVNVDVFQWEAGFEEAKQQIGTVALDGLKGETRIEIAYAINEDNLFEVHVKNMETNNVAQAWFERAKAINKPINLHTNKFSVTFIIDTTGSMDNYIDGVTERVVRFSNILRERGTEFELGLIGFGDLGEREEPTLYGFTSDVIKFQRWVKYIPRTSGGDMPESSLDALEAGVKMIKQTRRAKDMRNVFILITDAPPHVPTESGKGIYDVCAMLKENEITPYVIAKHDKLSTAAYEPITKPNGKIYSIDDEFYDIIDDIAFEIADLIRIV